MITQIEGKLIEKNPDSVILECGGIGYLVRISLNTYTKIIDGERCKLFTHLSMMQNVHTGEMLQSLYGFCDKKERIFFNYLNMVSGISCNKAIAILSLLSTEDLEKAILTNDAVALKSVKGIGEKVAQKIIVELKDRLVSDGITGVPDAALSLKGNKNREDAVSALVMLGYARNAAEKAVNNVLRIQTTPLTIDAIVKQSLKNI